MTTNADVTSTVALKPLDLSGDSLAIEKITYRGYAKLDEKGDKTDYQAKAEVANQVNWNKLIAAGYQLLNENEFMRYTLKSMKGFELLVPDEAQRLYIAQAGLNYIQNSKASGIMNDFEDNGITPKTNQQTVDLREAINEPPSKRALTDQQKLERLIKSMGLSPEETANLFAELAKSMAAQAPNPALEAGDEQNEAMAT